jgi:expansin
LTPFPDHQFHPGNNFILILFQVVDECPECAASHLDLFEDAFTQLGSASAGIIDITYTPVACGITSPIVLHNKSGTSAYWFSMQVVNANEPVASLEVSTDGGSTWQTTTRQSYNFFEKSSGFGTSTVDVKVTSTNGKSITVSGVSVASEARTTGSANF